jgi:hypothetical protein
LLADQEIGAEGSGTGPVPERQGEDAARNAELRRQEVGDGGGVVLGPAAREGDVGEELGDEIGMVFGEGPARDIIRDVLGEAGAVAQHTGARGVAHTR